MPTPTLHFLNVGEGDCSIIQHGSGHVSVIDVCRARIENLQEMQKGLSSLRAAERGIYGNFNQKRHPVNPIAYMATRGISSVFRFILSHPDMDHLDGIADFFEIFEPTNFYDIDNTIEKDSGWSGGRYREEDWTFYKDMRDGIDAHGAKRLTLHAPALGAYRTQDWDGNPPGDAITILAPSPGLVTAAEECGDWNDCSYVVLYRAHKCNVVFGGDSHDGTWEYILNRFPDEVADVDLLIAPHHGRDSERSYDFLDTLKPRLTFFGSARSEHLAYAAWQSRGLRFITNNQAGSMIVQFDKAGMHLHATHKAFAEKLNTDAVYDEELQAYYCETLPSSG